MLTEERKREVEQELIKVYQEETIELIAELDRIDLSNANEDVIYADKVYRDTIDKIAELLDTYKFEEQC